MAVPPDPHYADYVSLGPREYLDRFLDEFDLSADDVRGKVAVRAGIGSHGVQEDDYMIHESLLRSSSEFPCAGDAAAVEFCREIVEEMVAGLGLTRTEAVALVNRQWSDPDSGDRAPRVWIVGLDLVYHEEPAFWARHIYVATARTDRRR